MTIMDLFFRPYAGLKRGLLVYIVKISNICHNSTYLYSIFAADNLFKGTDG